MRSDLYKNLVIAGALIAAGFLLAWLRFRPYLESESDWTDGGRPYALADRAALRFAVWGESERLEGAVNTATDELGGSLSADGRWLVFSSGERGLGADLYLAELERGEVVDVRPLSGLNTIADECSPVLVGRSLYFASNRAGGAGGLDLYRASFDDGLCGVAEHLGGELASPADDTDPAPQASGEAIVFSSDRAGRLGGDHDLYLAQAVLDELGAGPRWSVHLLAELSSAFDERDPCFTADGGVLYFASDRAGGAGGYDLYRSVRAGPAAPELFLVPERLDSLSSARSERSPRPSPDGFLLHFAREGEAGDYDLERSRTIELFRGHGRPLAWIELVLFATLLLVALLAWLAKRWERLEVLYKCLLLSAVVHLLLLWWMHNVYPESGAVELRGDSARVRIRLVSDERARATRNAERAGELAELARADAQPRELERAETGASWLEPAETAAAPALERPTAEIGAAPARYSAAPERPATSAPAEVAVQEKAEQVELLSAAAPSVAVEARVLSEAPARTDAGAAERAESAAASLAQSQPALGPAPERAAEAALAANPERGLAAAERASSERPQTAIEQPSEAIELQRGEAPGEAVLVARAEPAAERPSESAPERGEGEASWLEPGERAGTLALEGPRSELGSAPERGERTSERPATQTPTAVAVQEKAEAVERLAGAAPSVVVEARDLGEAAPRTQAQAAERALTAQAQLSQGAPEAASELTRAPDAALGGGPERALAQTRPTASQAPASELARPLERIELQAGEALAQASLVARAQPGPEREASAAPERATEASTLPETRSAPAIERLAIEAGGAAEPRLERAALAAEPEAGPASAISVAVPSEAVVQNSVAEAEARGLTLPAPREAEGLRESEAERGPERAAAQLELAPALEPEARRSEALAAAATPRQSASPARGESERTPESAQPVTIATAAPSEAALLTAAADERLPEERDALAPHAFPLQGSESTLELERAELARPGTQAAAPLTSAEVALGALSVEHGSTAVAPERRSSERAPAQAERPSVALAGPLEAVAGAAPDPGASAEHQALAPSRAGLARDVAAPLLERRTGEAVAQAADRAGAPTPLGELFAAGERLAPPTAALPRADAGRDFEPKASPTIELADPEEGAEPAAELSLSAGPAVLAPQLQTLGIERGQQPSELERLHARAEIASVDDPRASVPLGTVRESASGSPLRAALGPEHQQSLPAIPLASIAESLPSAVAEPLQPRAEPLARLARPSEPGPRDRLRASVLPERYSAEAPELSAAEPESRELLGQALAPELETLPDRALEATPYRSRVGAAKIEALERFGGSQETEAAVARGLRYLVGIQAKQGYWGSAEDKHEKYGHVAVGKTGLCLLALLGAGHTPASDSEHAGAAARAVDFLLAVQDPVSGHFGYSSSYSHGIATYALAECYALTHDERLRKPIERAVAQILRKQEQNPDPRLQGGWGYYYPDDRSFDPWPRVSITSWQVMALESARLGGLSVPSSAFQRAKSFLQKSWDERRGAYRYSHDPSRLNSAYDVLPGSTPAAIFVLSLLGEDVSQDPYARARRFVMERLPDGYRYTSEADFVHRARGNPYFWYYGTLAMFRVGGQPWEKWNVAMKETLLPSQEENGSWRPLCTYADFAGDDEQDRSYTTAINVLSLEIYYRYFTPLLRVE